MKKDYDLPFSFQNCNIVINREDPRPPITYYVIYGQPLKSVDDDIVRWILWSCIVNIVHLWRWCPGAVIRASGEGQSVPSSHSTPPLYNSSLWVVFLPFHHFGRTFEHLHCTLTIPKSNPISDSIPHQFSVVLVSYVKDGLRPFFRPTEV